MKTTNIYALIDPITTECRYVGKSDNVNKRYKDHLYETSGSSHKECWIKSLLNKGTKPEILVLEEVPMSEWQSHEQFWIAYFKSIGARLTNSTNGGEGVVGLTTEAREKIGAPRRGIPRPESVKEKLRIACKGWKHSPETIEKIRINSTGRSNGPMSEEMKLRISKTKKGIPVPEEGRRKRSETMKGRVKSAEHREKLSLAAKADWARRKSANI